MSRCIKYIPILKVLKGISWAVLLGVSLSQAEVYAADLDINSARPIDSKKNGVDTLKTLVAKLRSLNTYEFDSDVHTYLKANHPKHDRGTFFFKKPHRVRIQVNNPGRKHGTVVVRRKDGQVRVKCGPAMLGLTMNLAENSRLLNNASGHNVLKSDLVSVMSKILRDTKSSAACLVSRPMQIYKTQVLVVDVVGSDKFVKQRVLVGAKTGLPVGWARYKNGKLFADIKVENLRTNLPLKDKLFEI